VNISGFTGLEIAYEDEAMLQAKDDIGFTSLFFENLAQKTTWPSLNEPEERLLYSGRIAAEMYDRAFESFRQELAKFNGLPYSLRANAFSRLNTDRRMFQYYLVFHRAYIEMQAPFSDYEYIDFAYAIPSQFLFDRKLRKAIILKTMPYLAGIPYDKDNLPITQNEVSRIAGKLALKTRTYINRHVVHLFPDYTTLNSDYDNWLRTDLRAWGEEILLGKQTLHRDIFNREFLESLWRRQQSGLETNIIGKTAPIMTWEMLMRKFCD
jgi:asparagine synthetase B (glutamine-hydrolysing)